MITTRILLILALLTGFTCSSFAQAGGRGPMATSALGHMAVTLLSPAAIKSDLSMATIRVSGNHATYAITVSKKSYEFSKNGNTISVRNFSSIAKPDKTGSNTIYIGATMNISQKDAASYVDRNEELAVTINYN